MMSKLVQLKRIKKGGMGAQLLVAGQFFDYFFGKK